MSDTFRPVAIVCLYGGLRISEALGLRWRDLDLEAGVIDVAGQLGTDGRHVSTKTESSEATVAMLPVVKRELVAHRRRQANRNLALLRDDAFVFVTMRGKPQSRRNALRAIHKAGDALGLNPDGSEPVGLHDLRHSLVAAAIDRGATAAEVAELARHANPRVTMTLYAGLTKDGRDRAVGKLTGAGFGT
jgi:integrase